MSEQGQHGEKFGQELGKDSGVSALFGENELPPKVVQVIESRKVWAGVIGLAATLTLWGMGEIDGARAVEAMTWVLGIFIGSVALEDGMTRLFSSLAHEVVADATSGQARPVGDKVGDKEAMHIGDDSETGKQ